MILGYDHSNAAMDETAKQLRRYGANPAEIPRSAWARVLREYEKSGKTPQMTDEELRAFDERFPDVARIKRL